MKTVKANNYKAGGAVGITGMSFDTSGMKGARKAERQARRQMAEGGNEKDKSCPGDNCAPTQSARGQRARQADTRRVNRQNERNKKSLNTGSNRRTIDRGRIVKIDKPGLIERVQQNRERRKKNKERDLGRYVSPRYM